MNYIKKFEELDFSQTIPSTSVDNLTNYYQCECSELFKMFNRKLESCPACGSKNFKSLDIDTFYSELQKKIGDEYSDQIQNVKSQEQDNFVNLTQIPQVSESLGDTKFNKLSRSALGFFLAPLTLPIYANSNSDGKIRIIKKVIIESYIEEKTEYKILDDIKYDIKKPSTLDKIFKRLKLTKKKFDKYKTLDEYINGFIKMIRKFEIINFRNRKDIDYIEYEVREFFSTKTEEEWIQEYLRKLRFDDKKGEVVRIKMSDLLSAVHQPRYNARGGENWG